MFPPTSITSPARESIFIRIHRFIKISQHFVTLIQVCQGKMQMLSAVNAYISVLFCWVLLIASHPIENNKVTQQHIIRRRIEIDLPAVGILFKRGIQHLQVWHEFYKENVLQSHRITCLSAENEIKKSVLFIRILHIPTVKFLFQFHTEFFFLLFK